MSADSKTTLPRPTVALIGLGTMGAGIAERLLDQGFAVDVWNRTPGPEARLTERGATAHVMPEQAAARASVVLTMLPTGDAVAEVMLERSALNAMRILASGPAGARSTVEPVFEALGRPVWLGESGAGSRMKLVLNTWLAFEIEATAEVAALADRLGVTHAALREAVAGGTLASGVAMTKLAKMESGDYSPDFSLEWALKDLDLARVAGGVEVTPVAESIAERWRRLVAEGYGRLDISAARMGLDSAPAGAASGQSA